MLRLTSTILHLFLVSNLCQFQFSNGFILPSRPSSKTSLIQLNAASTPPPSPPAAVEQVKKAPSTVSATSQASATSNIPSQKELAEKASPNTAPSKSTNVATGSGIAISDIHYDGVVPKTESDEYVVIINGSKEAVDISGYYIYVATTGTQGPTFTFPKGSVLKAGASVRIYTNEIHKETGGYSFGSGKAIWSNNGGLGVLKDSNGKKLGEYKYKPAKA